MLKLSLSKSQESKTSSAKERTTLLTSESRRGKSIDNRACLLTFLLTIFLLILAYREEELQKRRKGLGQGVTPGNQDGAAMADVQIDEQAFESVQSAKNYLKSGKAPFEQFITKVGQRMEFKLHQFNEILPMIYD